MGTIITKPGSGGGSQVGYRGFKYTVTQQNDGAAPNPTAGQAITWFQEADPSTAFEIYNQE